MEFEPILSGSMVEKTKCFYPNEVDIVCSFIHTESLKVRELNAFITLEETEETNWTSRLRCKQNCSGTHGSKSIP